MYQIQDWLKGRKTVGLGIALLVYVGVMAVNAADPDENIVYGLLAAMGLSIGAKTDRAVKNGSP